MGKQRKGTKEKTKRMRVELKKREKKPWKVKTSECLTEKERERIWEEGDE